MLGINKHRNAERQLAESATTLLTQVNKLVSQGLRQAALDLLEEAVSGSPHDTVLLRALGRVYLLDRQPEKAVVYLRRSLAVSDPTSIQNSEYIPEAFTNEDADYIEAVAEDSSTDEFSPLDEPLSEPPENDDQLEKQRRTLQLNRSSSRKSDSHRTDGSEPKVAIIKRGRAQSIDFAPASRHEPRKVIEFDELGEFSPGVAAQKSGQARIVSDGTEVPTDFADLGGIQAPRSAGVSGLSDTEIGLTGEDDEELEVVQSDLELSEDISAVSDIIDVDESFDNDLDDIDLNTDSAEDLHGNELEFEDFAWEDLEDFDEEASRENDDENLTQGGVARDERARQVAVDVLERVGWGREHLPLLVTIFVESGWGAARVAIENQIQRGALPEQIVLARQVRSIWFSNEYLWTAFRMRSNAPFMQAEAVYKNFSWADALRLIRCFPSIPDEFEIEAFIEDLFEDWYFNNRLRRHFNAFLKYLRYRIGAGRRTLPGSLDFSFSLPLEEEWGAENPELLSEISEARNELRVLGAESGFAMPGAENKFKVLPQEASDEDKDRK